MATGLFNLKQQLQGLIQKAWTGTQKTNFVEYLVVAGGGGGGGGGGGDAAGGGAGGLLQGIIPVANGVTYTVTVGAAGTAGTGSANGGQGGDSVFSNITATGGGAGGGISTTTSGGGSGGGNIYPENTRSFGIVGQGNAGGLTNTGDRSGGSSPGGGGAGTVGLSTTSSSSGNGGAGIASSISGSVVVYAGGGGGGTYASQVAGVGGVGGGGNGGQASPSTSATAGATNTGGGGGGGKNGVAGAAGGSGIVIISYPDIYSAPTFGGANSPTSSTSGSGSVLFSGTTNQGLVYTNLSSLSSVSGNFTIEYWMYVTAYGNYQTTISSYPTQPSIYVCHQFLSGSSSTFSFGTHAGTSTFTASLNTWYNITQVRVGSTITNYVNGVSIGTFTTASTFNLSTFAIGNYSTTASSYTFNGNISNLRIVTSALYTSNFTPSTTPLTAISGTGMLINTVSGAPYVDSSTNMASVALLSSSVASPTWNQSSPFATGLGYKNRVYTWTGNGTVTF